MNGWYKGEWLFILYVTFTQSQFAPESLETCFFYSFSALSFFDVLRQQYSLDYRGGNAKVLVL